MDEVVAAGGGTVLGVCNGFQVLCEAGLLPGALRHNESRKFICRNVLLRPESLMAPMTAGLPDGQPLCIPIAHGEGNYTIDDAGLDALEDGDQILFRYCGPDGGIGDEFNPTAPSRTSRGLQCRRQCVRHDAPPERACSEALGNTDGRAMLAASTGGRGLIPAHGAPGASASFTVPGGTGT